MAVKKQTSAKKTKTTKEDSSKITKRPLSAYMYFMKEFRDKNKDKYHSVSELAKGAGDQWKALTESEKKPFEKLAEKDKARYENDIANGMVVKKKKEKAGGKKDKAGKKEKDPNRPKKFTTAYLFFLAEFRKSCDKPGKVIMSLAAEKWKTIGEAEKKKFLELEQKDRERYNKEMEKYNAENKVAVKSAPKKKKPAAAPVKDSEEEDDEDEDDDDEDEEDDE